MDSRLFSTSSSFVLPLSLENDPWEVKKSLIITVLAVTCLSTRAQRPGYDVFFYRAGHYGRLDFFTDPFRIQNIDSKIGWNIHIVAGKGIHHSQQLLMCVRF